jgi:5-methylcytosine-specific restriction protein B
VEDFYQGIIALAKISVTGRTKSQFRSQYSEKHNLWIIEAALNESVLNSLFANVDIESKPEKMIIPLNTILYGPPGTGKTFNTINRAISIINSDFNLDQQRKVIKDEFNRLVEEGQIVFTTFHQSMSYEDFVEGIKPQEPKDEGHQISYKVEGGIFKKLCQKANSSFGNIESVIEDFKKEISEVDGKKPITINAKGTSFDVVYRGTNVFYIQPHASIKDKPWYPANIDHILKVFKTGDFSGVYNPTYVREIINFLEKYRGLKKG